jgi:TPP-dependent pyruvate/acetoin dehydrogenase alpha subunit
MSAIKPQEAREFYRQMCLIRCFETRAYELYMQGVLPGAIHAYSGEEAVAVGVCANLMPEDYVLSTHRGHGHCLAKKADPKLMLAEMLGKSTGLCRGKAGSMHVCDPQKGLLGCNGIVGAGIPMSVGVGLSIKLQATEQVCVCFFGDGASNQGTFHESLNMASVWKLPVVFVCENNLYAMSTKYEHVTAVERTSDRAASYAMPGRSVDGMDIEAVYTAAGEFIKRAREGEGPALLECRTYRFRGHSRWDPDHGPYRSQQELERWKELDPLKVAVNRGLVSADAAREIERAVEQEVEEAVQYAIDAPLPEATSALEDVYCSWEAVASPPGEGD